MTWEEFSEYLSLYAEAISNAPVLGMSGVQHDNATRYLETQKGCDWAMWRHFLVGGAHFGDFVWFGGNTIRAFDGCEGGGHAALAGFNQVRCAGVIDKKFFTFHSGHYHPKEENARLFLLVFVRECCAQFQGREREEILNELCNIKHIMYEDDAEERGYQASLAELLGRQTVVSEPLPSSSGARSIPIPIPMGRTVQHPSRPQTVLSSRPAPTYKPMPTIARMPTTSAASSSSTHAATGLATTLAQGISPAGRHLRRKSSEGGRPIWTPDSEVSKCQGCHKDFNTIRWKHHCRQCGGIFCDNCSRGRKSVRNPAQDGGKAESGELRVCTTCFKKVELV
jgi:hypothetical protein